uniref:Phosphatidylinositol-specific phospholipase C X domain-containing protein n=1 Tax=Oryza punctata TaxID=4537 RepID=A0A0E0LQC6_ORYPU
MAPRLRRRLAVAALLALVVVASGASAAQVGDTCSSEGDCGAGLHCSDCGGGGDKTCTRAKPIDPLTHGKGTGLPFNNYSWLTTHNSFALAGASSATGSTLITQTNQEDTITAQLKNGVRGLMLDTYDFNNDVWLCHSFQGKCLNFTAFQPAINVLKEIRTFLDANPSEVITIFLEDYTASGSLPKVFNASGLMKYWFPVAKMPKSGGDWPLLKDMISQNERLLVFTSKKSKEASEGIAYEWSYVVENQYGNEGMVEGKCPNRAESPAMDSKSQSLVLMNFFTTDPSQTGVCANNSAPLVSMLKTCHDLSGNRWPNYIAVDFYMRSDGGGAPLATDIANGHLVCGCDNIAYCKANSTFGTCVIPPPPPPPSPRKAPSGGKGASAGGSSSSSGAMARVVLPKLSFFFGVALLVLVILSY